MIHLQIPLWLYLNHFSSPKPVGYGLIAGFDLTFWGVKGAESLALPGRGGSQLFTTGLLSLIMSMFTSYYLVLKIV